MDLRTLLIAAILAIGIAQANTSALQDETVVEALDTRPRQSKINVEIDPNDIENNEIEGSSTKKKPVKAVEEVKEEESNDWFSYILSFIGYKSFSELVKNVDIFSIPQTIQNATRTYKEEIGVGQCYMEYFTFSAEHLVEESRAADNSGQVHMINNIAQSVISMLQKSPATAKYGTTIKQILPMVLEVIGNENPQQAMIQFATKNLLPLITSSLSGAGQSNNVVEEKITYQHQPPPVIENSVHSPTSPSPSTGSALSPLIKLVTQYFLGGNRDPSPAKRPLPPPKKTQIITKAQEKVDKKTSFTQTILDFIQPLFISIVGSAPGDNGVEAYRKVDNLINQRFSRITNRIEPIDEQLIEEVQSYTFCAKNYMINKAWSLTEKGVNYFVGYIDSAQQGRLARMLTHNQDLFEPEDFAMNF